MLRAYGNGAVSPGIFAEAPCAAGVSHYCAGMFELTNREQWLVAGFIAILMLGAGMKHWREKAPEPAAAAALTTN